MKPTKTERAFDLLVKIAFMIDAETDVKRMFVLANRFNRVRGIYINSGTILP